MSQSSPNPYQPAAPIEPAIDAVDGHDFRITTRLLRFGEAQYLLHWRSSRLVTGSLTMILLSAMVFVAAMLQGRLSFGIAVIGAVTVSTLVYGALVRRDSVQIRQNLQRLGLVDGAAFDVDLTPEEMILHSPNGVFRWPRDSLRTYRTRKGILLCPEPLTFVLVPSQNESPTVYQRLREEALSKNAKRPPRREST
ncbi:MAG: hypothetical protein ACR2NZ_03665 [Rubripirellula sp.]